MRWLGPAPCISYRGYTRKCLQLHFETTLPNEKQLVKTGIGTRNFTTVYANLTPELAKKLKDLAKKEDKVESNILRKILDSYFKDIDKKGLPYEPLRKFSPVGLKLLPRTIRKEQGIKLMELTEETGRKMSELVRDAIESFFE